MNNKNMEIKRKLSRDEIVIREETSGDFYEVESMTKRAFWNKYKPGCNEHYLVHKMRDDLWYLPELSRVALKDGEIIGAIFYCKGEVVQDGVINEVLSFGPLCVDPKWQGMGVGAFLLEETIKLAKHTGYKGIIILGEVDYYPRFGSVPCNKFGITTSDGKNFPAFMCLELSTNSMENINGKFYYADVFNNLPDSEVEEFDKQFPYMEKLKLPGQWT